MIPVSSKTGAAQKNWIERVQARLTLTTSLLGNLKSIQMLGFSEVLSTTISVLRTIEIKTSLQFRKLLIWQIALCKKLLTGDEIQYS